MDLEDMRMNVADNLEGAAFAGFFLARSLFEELVKSGAISTQTAFQIRENVVADCRTLADERVALKARVLIESAFSLMFPEEE